MGFLHTSLAAKIKSAATVALIAAGLLSSARAEVDLSVSYPEVYSSSQFGAVMYEAVLNTEFYGRFIVFNRGDEPATHVSLTPGLPPEFTIISADPPVPYTNSGNESGIQYPNPNNPNPGYDIEVLPPGCGVQYSYKFTCATAGDYPVTLSATCAEPESDSSDNATSSVIKVFTESTADISATLTADKTTMAVFDNVTFTANITNNGPGVASLVRFMMQVYGQVPAHIPGLQFVSGTISTGGPLEGGDNGVYIWENPLELQPGQTVTVTATYKSLIAGDIIADLQVNNTALQSDPQPLNNHAELSLPMTGAVPQFDLEAQLKMSPAVVQPGGLMVEQLVVKNHGPDDATSITLASFFGDFNLGGGILFQQDMDLDSIVDAGGWNLQQTTNSLFGTLPSITAGESSTVTLVFKIKDNPTGLPQDPNRILHSFRIESRSFYELDYFTTSTQYKPNTSYAEVAINRNATGDQSDLEITRNAPLEVPIGMPYSYSVTARNLGPAPTSSAVLANVIPPGVKVVQAKSDKGAANIAGNFVSLDNVPLAVGESATVNITVVPEELGHKTYSGKIASSQFDPTLGNNNADAITLIKPDGPIVNPDQPCIDMPDLIANITQVRRKGKFKKKTQQWTYKVQAKVAVTNIGTGCALDNSTVKLYLSNDPILDSADMLIGGKQVKKLCPPKKAGKAPKPKKVSVKAKLAPGVNPFGCYVLAVVDADGGVYECNESNNIALSLE